MVKLFVTRRALLGKAAMQYLLRDEFSDTLAAGAVNGTPATPGPGVRTVVTDSLGALTVAGGMATATATETADPLLSLGAYTRTAGLVLISKSTAALQAYAGWGSVGATTPTVIALYFNNVTLTVSLGTSIAVGTVVNNTTYQCALVLRATGGFLFIKGGTFTNWTLVWVLATGVVTPVYARACWRSGLAAYDYLRVPAQLWTPTPLAGDSFNRANATLHNSLTDGAAVEEIGGARLVWTAPTWTIAGNVALNTPTGTEWVTDGDMELVGVANWTGYGTPTTLAKNAVAPIAGLQDLHVAMDATFEGAWQIFGAMTAGTWIRMETTLRRVAGLTTVALGQAAFTYILANQVSPAGNTTYRMVVRITANMAGPTLFLACHGVAPGDFYYDNVSVVSLSLPTLFATVPCNTPDVLVELPITDAGGNAARYQVGIVVNLDSAATPANFIIAYLNGDGTCKLDECVAGVYTAKISAAVVYAAGAKLKVIRNGTSCAVYYNELQVGTTQTMTANINVNHGMFSTHSTPTLNNLAIFARGTGGEYAALDAF